VTTVADGAYGPRVREATRADLLDVFRIEKRSFPQPWPFGAFERFLDRPGFLVADAPDDATGLAGFVVADTVPNHGRPIGHVKDIAVAPDYRGRGIGTTLLERALGILATEGTRAVKLEVRASNDVAIRLYERHGFEVRRTVPRYYDDGEDALVMIRDG
jgi:ribosomal-protein-alanine N-acetyltransferase